MVSGDATYYQRLLEALYSGLEGRDVTGYAWDASDGWTRSRTPPDWRAHLECWIDLGGRVVFGAPSYTHECRLVFGARYHADSDSLSQARLQAAIRDAAEYLLTRPLPDGARVQTLTDALVEGVYEGGWVTCTVSFDLYLQRS